MQNLPIFPSDYRRQVAKEPLIPMVNRFVEANPSLTDAAASFIARPGLRRFAEVGSGPIRCTYSSPGAFNSDLFVVSGTELYRISSMYGTSTLIGTISSTPIGDVSMAATSPIGTEVPSYLFLAEGGVLWYYSENGHARAQLSVTGLINNSDTIELNGVYYRWTNGSVNTGTPAGTVGSPWLVDLGISNGAAMENMFLAINQQGEPGVTYSTPLVANPFVEGISYDASVLFAEANEPGTASNIFTSTSTGTNISFTNGATFAGGGSPQLAQVTLPEAAGAVSVAYINSFVIVVPVQDDAIGTTGRFYWIEPGERTIDPLNFANAERSSDRINQVITFSDMFWLFGDVTTEPWVTTGNPEAPMQRFQGIIFDRGSWEGTAIKVRDSMVVVDEEGGVFIINNGQRRISNPSIEERIRQAIAQQII